MAPLRPDAVPERPARGRRPRSLLNAALTVATVTLTMLATAIAVPTAALADDDRNRGGQVRVVVTTDGEGDDIASMHRLLLYGNDVEIAGIVSSSSRWHWAGDPTATPPIGPNRWDDPAWIPELIDGPYRAVQDNLRRHDRAFPTADELLSVVKIGNITNQDEFATNTEGSEFIKNILLDRRPGPVSLQAWGGNNTIAAALRAIEDQYRGTPEWDAVRQRVSDKAVLYLIQDQDLTYRNYIRVNWPDVRVVVNRDQFEAFAYGYRGYNPPAIRSLFERDWVAANLLQGPFMAGYPLFGQGLGDICRGGPCQPGDWFSEGDSPALLHAIPTGLDNFENPTFGGWGGRFVQVGPRLWADAPSYLGLPGQRATDLADQPALTVALRAAAEPGATQPALTVALRAAAEPGATQVALSRNNNPTRSGLSPGSEILVGDKVAIGSGDTAETRTVTASFPAGLSPNDNPNTVVTLDRPLERAHPVGTPFVDFNGTHWPQVRWHEDIQRDFAARVRWTIADRYRGANHHPSVEIDDDGDCVTARPGQRVSVEADTSDPDRNRVSVTWSNYREAGTYPGAVQLSRTSGEETSLRVPADATTGQTIHLIAEAADNGAPVLTAYDRVVVHVVEPGTRGARPCGDDD